jgi:hypothetical protein
MTWPTWIELSHPENRESRYPPTPVPRRKPRRQRKGPRVTEGQITEQLPLPLGDVTHEEEQQ